MRIYSVHTVFGARKPVITSPSRSALPPALLLAAALAPPGAFANAFRLPDQDAFATARGEAFVATADNAAAVYYNPAGLAQLEGNQLRAGVYGLYFDPTYSPPRSAPNQGHTYSIDNNLAAVPQFFYAFTPQNSAASFGFGVYAPFGLSATWPQDTGFRTVAIKGSLTYITLNPAVALKLAPNLFIGAGLMANYANLDLEQGVRVLPTPPNSFEFAGEGWGFGYNLGALWKPVEQLSFGGMFRSTSTITLSGHTRTERIPQLPPTRRGASTDLTFPLTAVLGVSYRPTPKWNFEFDADYTDWSSFGTLLIHQSEGVPPVTQKDVSLTMDWQPSWIYEFGVTRYFDSGWHVSAGYAYNETSVPDAHYTPLVADLDRHFFSAGSGYRGRHCEFDLAYQFGYGPAHTVTGSTPSTAGQIAGQTADGTYKFISHAVFLTVGLRF